MGSGRAEVPMVDLGDSTINPEFDPCPPRQSTSKSPPSGQQTTSSSAGTSDLCVPLMDDVSPSDCDLILGVPKNTVLVGVVGVCLVGYLIAAYVHDAENAHTVSAVYAGVLCFLLIRYMYHRNRISVDSWFGMCERHILELLTGRSQYVVSGLVALGLVSYMVWALSSEVPERAASAGGLACFVAVGYGLSYDRKAIVWRPVVTGLLLQFLLGVLVHQTSPGYEFFKYLSEKVSDLLAFAEEGCEFLFGENFRDHDFAMRILPTVIYFSALVSVLFYAGMLQPLIVGIASVVMKTMRTSGSESLCAASNIFLGQTEAPLLIRPFVHDMTMSEIHAVMTGGFATVAGSVLAAYISFGISGKDLITASVMSAPAALAISKLMYPETEVSKTRRHFHVDVEKTECNVLDAAAKGTTLGLQLALNIGAMLIAFLALVALLDSFLGFFGAPVGVPQLSFDWICGYLYIPIAFALGVPPSECHDVAVLIGKKTFLNEFVAYVDLAENSDDLSERATTLATYALCGFSNVGAIGIQIAGLSALCPERQKDFATLAWRAMIAGSLACFMTASLTGMLI